MYKRILWIMGIVFLIKCTGNGQTPAGRLPEFIFFKLDKSEFRNKDLLPGKHLFIIFFDSECDHCQRALHSLNQHYAELTKIEIYLISQDDKERIKQFMNKYAPKLVLQKNVVLLQDLKNQFITLFQPKKYPSLYLYSPTGDLIDYEDNEESLFRIYNHIHTLQ